MADYFDDVESEVREAQRIDPDVVLPWSWWQERGERHGMSPNAIYTRAVKVGLYVPPPKRPAGVPSHPEAHEPALTEPDLAQASTGPSRHAVEPPLRRSGPTVEEPNQRRIGSGEDSPAPRNRPIEESPRRRGGIATQFPSFEPGGIGEAIQNFASMAERTAHLERQVDDLTLSLDAMKQENRRLRRALREMEELSSQMAHVFRNAVMADE